jgi:LPS export ABC transporter protein LptC
VVLKLHRQRISRILFVSVALFVVAVAGVLVLRGRGAQSVSSEAPQTTADYRIKEVWLQEELKDGVSWQLQADQAESYEKTGKTLLREVRILIQEPDRSWTVTGDEGEMTRESKDVELRGHVVLTSSDGLRLETTRLRWDASEKRAWTDEPVILRQKGAVVRGTGLDARVGERNTAIKGRIRATFGASKPGSDKPDASPTEDVPSAEAAPGSRPEVRG